LKYGSLCSQSKAVSQRFVLSGGAAKVSVTNVSNVMMSLCIEEKQKRKATTAMNEQSSRVHSFSILTL